MRFDWKLSVLAACVCSLGCADFHRGPAPQDAGSEEGGPAGPTFERSVYPILETYCQHCHQAGGAAGGTYLILTGNASMDRVMVEALVVPGDPSTSLLLRRATGDFHYPGQIFTPDSLEYDTIASWISSLPAEP